MCPYGLLLKGEALLALKNRIIFSADTPGKSIVNNDGTAMNKPPVGRTAEIDSQQIVFVGNILKIAELEKLPIRLYMEIVADNGEIGNGIGFFHNEITVIRGNKQYFSEKVGIIHFRNNGFHLILCIALGIAGGL